MKIIAYTIMFILYILSLVMANAIGGYILVILVTWLLGMLVWGIAKGVL